MVIVEVPTVAALLAVRVITLLPVAGLAAKAAVTPFGNPDAAKATLPVNPPRSVILMVSVALLPCETDRVDADGASVKLGGVLAATVKATVVVSVSEPEVPVIVTVEVPTVAVLLAVSVSTLLPVAGFVPKAAVTPLGNPDAARVTLPVNGLMSVTEMVSVALLPCVTESADCEGASAKVPIVGLPQVFPLMANDVGIALVAPFQVPLKPNPLVLPRRGCGHYKFRWPPSHSRRSGFPHRSRTTKSSAHWRRSRSASNRPKPWFQCCRWCGPSEGAGVLR